MSQNIFEGLQSPFPSAPTVSPPVAGPSGEAPPPYSTLPAGAVEFTGQGWVPQMQAVINEAGHCPLGMKLSSMDFVPRLIRKRVIGRDEYENFASLLQRANTWLDDHSNLVLISCETLTWFGSSAKEIFSDSTSFRRVSGTMTYMRGLRFWYLTKMVPSPSHGPQAQAVQCQIFPARVTENFAQLMKRVNDRLAENASIGRILGVETVRFDREDGSVNTELTFWKEDSGDTKQVVFGVRVFSILSESGIRETIGYQDFVPEKTTRSKDNRGYELYSDVMDRAARWIARQQGVRFTNLQTIPIKIKKQSSFEERCAFTEHGRRVTPYLQVIRAYFVICPAAAAPGVNSPLPARLTYRTFGPVLLAPATGSTPPKYEDVRTVVDRINHWLQLTGARLFSIETVPVRLTSAGSVLGADATFVPNQDGGTYTARFLFHLRIYLNGDYMEPPRAGALVF